MRYQDRTEAQKESVRKAQRKWYAANPGKAKELKEAAMLKAYGPTVYTYFDRAGKAIYTGKSNYRKRRLTVHKKDSPWWKNDLIIVSMSCKDEWEAMEYEGKWGGYYQPFENIDGQRLRKYRELE